MYHLYQQLVFLPLYNGLVGLMDIFPGIDLGIAVVIFTIIIRMVLYPLSKSSLLTQVRMKEIEPEVNKIKAQYSKDRQAQALKIMELYKSKNVKPFSGVLLLLIQIPILIALISVFYKISPQIHPELLYSFIHVPQIDVSLLGINLTNKNIFLALLTGVAQFLQLHFSIASRQVGKTENKPVTGTDFSALSQNMAQNMNTQMKFFLPILAFVSTYWIIPAKFPQAASIIAVYWTVSALFSLAQELYIRKRHTKTA